MKKCLCIHGHFYQPPREDPWLNAILPEGSAAPSLNWNQRITRESYAPMARARRLDGQGRIADIMNCYEWMSFNAGPTLLSWMDKAFPDTVRLMAQADKASAARLGHGNAMAQVYHHQILPLASPLDKELEVAWAVHDFQARFGRDPEGMWLAETAVDTPSLEVLAAWGVRFTVLAPGQARAVAPLEGGAWTPVDQGSLDIRRPYLVTLPSGRSLSVFFYDGPLSQAVAFERLLADGEGFWQRLSQAAGPGLLALATDGETYGHHFTFGEMALAFVLDQARRERDGLGLTNFAAFLAANPPAMQVRLHEPSAWSCAHGVERWRSDCGCSTGGHPGWHQRWRAPLRQALQGAKDLLDAHFFSRGAACFADPRQALTDYGRVLAGLEGQEEFAARHHRRSLAASERDAAWKLLSMQQWGLSSLASCAWFFDELSRIEPVNALTFCLRAAELARRTGGPDVEAAILPILETAESNLPEYGHGGRIFRSMVKPRQETPGSLAAQALLTLRAGRAMPAPGATASLDWPGVSLTVAPETEREGLLDIAWSLETGSDRVRYAWDQDGDDPLGWPVRVADFADAADGSPAHHPARLCAGSPCAGLAEKPGGVAGAEPGGEPVGTPGGTSRLESGAGPKGSPEAREVFLPRSLPVNKRQGLADAFAVAASEALWQEALGRMEFGAHLVTELQEAQSTMTLAPRWAGMWTGLAWVWLWGLSLEDKRRELLLAFLRLAAVSDLEREGLMERVRQRALRELDSPSPDWDGLCRMVERARELGLPQDWWAVQNHLWETGLFRSSGRGLALLLGFAA